jgi:hypothetical protein
MPPMSSVLPAVDVADREVGLLQDVAGSSAML